MLRQRRLARSRLTLDVEHSIVGCGVGARPPCLELRGAEQTVTCFFLRWRICHAHGSRSRGSRGSGGRLWSVSIPEIHFTLNRGRHGAFFSFNRTSVLSARRSIEL